MNIRNLALTSAGVLALSIGAALAGNDPYTHNPTPEERAQTQDLNEQQAGDAQDFAAQNAQTQENNAAARAQYNIQQKQYQDQHDAWVAQQQDYADERAEYNETYHPRAWWHDHYERASLRSFYDVPRRELVDLRVTAEDGRTVGFIRDIDRADDGHIARVQIQLRDGERAWLPARNLRYDAEERIVFTDLTPGEVLAAARNS